MGAWPRELAVALTLALVSCGPKQPAAASRPAVPPYEVNPTKRPAPGPAPEPTVSGPDLHFEGPAQWERGETVVELVVTVHNRRGAGPAVGPITVSVRDKTGEHVGERPAYPKKPLPGDASLVFQVVMPTKPPAGTLLTITVSYTNEYADEDPSDNAITFRVP